MAEPRFLVLGNDGSDFSWHSNFELSLQSFQKMSLPYLKKTRQLQLQTSSNASCPFNKVRTPKLEKILDDKIAFEVFSIQTVAEWLISHPKLETTCERRTKSLQVDWSRWRELQSLKRRKWRPTRKTSHLSGRLLRLFQRIICQWSQEWRVSIQFREQSSTCRCLFTCFHRCSWKLYNQVEKSLETTSMKTRMWQLHSELLLR